MFTKTNVTETITTSIEAGMARADEFDIDAIADAIYEENGSWDIAGFDSDRFWAIVEDNAL